MTDAIPPLPRLLIDEAAAAALKEDWGLSGDITSNAAVPADARFRGVIAARKPGALAGVDLAARAFALTDPKIDVRIERRDGVRLATGDRVLMVEGPARSVLAAERVGLNYLQHLSGVASATADLVQAVSGTGVRIVCTRKTTPGLRAFEKHAVLAGGGANHRFGLNDAVLIKDNHIAAAGGVEAALNAAKSSVGHLVKIEVEVDTLQQLDDVLAIGCDAVLLDNMRPEALYEAVKRIDGQVIAEASGNITLETVRAVAETGVDCISSGWITHSAPALDLGLDAL